MKIFHHPFPVMRLCHLETLGFETGPVKEAELWGLTAYVLGVSLKFAVTEATPASSHQPGVNRSPERRGEEGLPMLIILQYARAYLTTWMTFAVTLWENI